ncbi:NAD(P)/FAD-dependent oxidoreductase [Desulfuromonas thiophila]|jgi:uncharacterized FAD-dependent dehydrogenase|uniref:NAD(P)/FAD-dependent oxidoreductase n=1 Tax=Desulfuromonas thiophila TaxID=57664 RepID=UPI0024A9E9A1|nr:FAD-binding protein [Desulfuromonas thiophila]
MSRPLRWRLAQLALTLEEDESQLPLRLAQQLGLKPEQLADWRICRRSIDARRKQRILRLYTLEFSLQAGVSLPLPAQHMAGLEPVPPPVVAPALIRTRRPRSLVVVGMGPAGLFAALELAQCGHRVRLLERGAPVEERVPAVAAFWAGGPLLPDTNVQFGEGGAGTFSDGKLTTRIRHPATAQVLQTLVDCGAPADILVQAKPHVGTDRLRRVLLHFRQRLLALGVELCYHSRLTGLQIEKGCLQGLEWRDRAGESRYSACDALVLATGHSARDTYQLLAAAGLELEAKPFAVGVRIEHPVTAINRMQYGREQHPHLPPADYALTWNDSVSGRGVYSFCMCPGGEVVQSASEPDTVVVNGMSRLRRDGPLSNSALVVTVRPEDFGGLRDPLAGIAFQRRIEQRACGGPGDYRVPAQNLLDFLGQGRGGDLHSSCRAGLRPAELRELLPDFVYTLLRQALPQFDRRMRGFVSGAAVLLAPETRTSAPVRILRGADLQATRCCGLYPAGEGAGYAGGIVSAAVDGLRVARQLAADLDDARPSGV